jgi:NAD(P)-dependent dehydrogenase (short-subunit alcohol dehydrogenase family)
VRVFLAGATGVIGRRLAALLRDAKHDVTATTRTPAKLQLMQSFGIAPIVVDLAAEGVRQLTVQGVVALEREVLTNPDIDGVVLRYGYLYGRGTWYDLPPKPPSVHVDAAAHAALLAVSAGAGVYNIAEDDGAVSSSQARRELGCDPAFRIQ